MRLKGPVLPLLVVRFLRHLIYVTTLFAPILIKGSNAQNDNLQGKEPCSLCSGEGEVGYPDATIPLFMLSGNKYQTCSDLDFVASLVPTDSKLCAKYQANAGYCGCPEATPLDHCTFCPNGDVPSRSEFILPMGETCKNLHTYISFFGEDQCASSQYKEIANHAYDCGCEISMSEVLEVFRSTRRKADGCTLCSDGSSPPEENHYLQLAGMSCGDYATFIDSLDTEQCELQTSRGTFDLFAYQCKCPGTTPPVCPKRENSELCTVSLLNSINHDEPCECYSFCDGEFVGCDSYPGNFLRDKCPQNGVSGCNYASAIDDINGSGTEVEDHCSICPDSTNNIVNPDAILPPFSGLTIPGSKEQSTCRDLIDYLSMQNLDDGDCKVAKDRLAHYCGCDNVEPNCTLCPGGIQPSFKNKIATEDTTCEDFAGTVLTWESETCEIGESYLSITGARCGCITAEWPVCPVQQNSLLCTTNLLRSTNEDCACYNFCGDQFHSCSDYPGGSLEASECPAGVTLIAGCNQALATLQRCSRPSIGPGCDDVDSRGKTYLRH
jgi:hypothetical protein